MSLNLCENVRASTVCCNKTRQGYARKRILKLAGYFFRVFAGGVQP
jgi:hypothetical protein